MKKIIASSLLLFIFNHACTQPDRWQQHIGYQINVEMNVLTNRFTGTEKINYWNNSPDTLNRIFFHLYWNAFQPGSMMDVHNREFGKRALGTDKKGETVYDWDERVKDRISKLKANETGYDSVKYVRINNTEQKLIYHETILEVKLSVPLLPHSKTSMELAFEAQVPVQILRSGRDNAEGIRYSMSQWYPKMAEYDYLGWNADPYIEREFYGVWGDYEVNITIDKNYMLSATGTLQNANNIGFGYEEETIKVNPATGNTNTWKFSAQNVHDFVWAADPSYTMIKKQITNGPLLYFVYKKADTVEQAWKNVADRMVRAYPYIAKTFGPYPYKSFSFIQGGDRGMEYPMATLLKNAGSGALHEFLHSWYYGMMGTNESLYAWMDEGFTEYAETRVNAWLNKDTAFPFDKLYTTYFRLVKSGLEEPLSTHADHFNTHFAYEVGSYYKGAIFLKQLGYIVGDEMLDKIFLEYYREWRFKHPVPDDFIRVAEKLSGIELKWYKEYWIYTTKTVDYALGDVNTEEDKTKITLKRIGTMPMPVDVLITYKDRTKEMHYIPMNLMYGFKSPEDSTPRILHNEWKWVDPEYSFDISRNVSDIKEIEIDPGKRTADMNRINNKITVPD